MNEQHKIALCNGYMTAIVRPLVGLKCAEIEHAIRILRALEESRAVTVGVAETLQAVYCAGLDATETPSGAALFGNPNDLEFEGD